MTTSSLKSVTFAGFEQSGEARELINAAMPEIRKVFRMEPGRISLHWWHLPDPPDAPGKLIEAVTYYAAARFGGPPRIMNFDEDTQSDEPGVVLFLDDEIGGQGWAYFPESRLESVSYLAATIGLLQARILNAFVQRSIVRSQQELVAGGIDA